jgi:hypothetical protein
MEDTVRVNFARDPDNKESDSSSDDYDDYDDDDDLETLTPASPSQEEFLATFGLVATAVANEMADMDHAPAKRRFRSKERLDFRSFENAHEEDSEEENNY